VTRPGIGSALRVTGPRDLAPLARAAAKYDRANALRKPLVNATQNATFQESETQYTWPREWYLFCARYFVYPPSSELYFTRALTCSRPRHAAAAARCLPRFGSDLCGFGCSRSVRASFRD